MAKKGAILFVIACSFLFFAVLASAEADVAYIFRKEFRIDDNVVTAFENQGLSVEFINEENIGRVDFNDYRILFVGDENFRNAHRFPVNDMPTVIITYYHGDTFGLSDLEGVSELASNKPLSVRVDNRVLQVYSSSTDARRRGNLAYYFIDKTNLAAELTTIALAATTSSGSEFGDVISYAEPGIRMANGRVQNEKLCFFGIVSSDYWTTAAAELFNDCISFVAAECSSNDDCPVSELSDPFCFEGDVFQTETAFSCQNRDSPILHCAPDDADVLLEECAFGCEQGRCLSGIHDVAFRDINNAVNNIRIEDAGGTDLLDSVLRCEQDYKITVSPINKGDFAEDITFVGSVGDISLEHNPVFGLLPGQNRLRSKTLRLDLEEGMHTIAVSAQIEEDDNILDNTVIRDIQVSCPAVTCFENNDCGVDGFVDEQFCSSDSLVRPFEKFTCNNPGSRESFCSSDREERVIEVCDDECVENECIVFNCETNEDCNDHNPQTFDQCINPGTQVSVCRNTPINCASDDECGFTGFIGEEMCSIDDVVKNFQTATCINPGEPTSHCDIRIEPNIVSQCEFACVNAACIACDENADCNDDSSSTRDVCSNPGTEQSFCSNEIITTTNIACFTSSDCGVINPVSDLFCSDTDVVSQLLQVWTCNDPGSEDSFCSSGTVEEVIQQCNDVCVEGVCTDISCFEDVDCVDDDDLTTDMCNNPGTPESFCSNRVNEIICSSNEECGESKVISEGICLDDRVTQVTQVFRCHNPESVESFCSSEFIQETVKQCDNTCNNGECVVIDCFSHSDCNDNDPSTLDICNAPGSPNAFCSNNPFNILCYSDGECGSDEIVESNLCVDSSVSQVSQSFTCNNPGTVDSFCSSERSQDTLEMCDFACLRGTCVLPECTTDEDCSDDNSLTFDQCVNPGSSLARCENTPVNCARNSDCGIDHFVGGEYCLGDDIVKNFQGAMCFNPGLPTAVCVLESAPTLVNSCEFACVEGGICARCNDHRDCIDSDSSTEDVCFFPGTVESHCENIPLTECTPGDTKQCGESDLSPCSFGSQLCQNDGSWSVCVGAVFPSAEFCDGRDNDCDGLKDEDGVCAVVCIDTCDRGVQQCSGKGVISCEDFDGDGCSEWSSVSSCGYGQQCEEGTCRSLCVNECVPGSQRCWMEGVETCNDFDGNGCVEWSLPVLCAQGSFCTDGKCVSRCVDKCVSGSRQCAAEGTRVCQDFDGDGCAEWSTVSSCGFGKSCSGGVCVRIS